MVEGALSWRKEQVRLRLEMPILESTVEMKCKAVLVTETTMGVEQSPDHSLKLEEVVEIRQQQIRWERNFQ